MDPGVVEPSVPAERPVVVHGLPGLWGTPSASPFVIKLMTWLRMAGIPYVGPTMRGPPASRTKKMPYVTLPDGSQWTDSALIIEELGRRRGVDLDAALDAEQRAQALAVRRMIEEHLYFAGLWERWVTPQGRAASSADYFRHVPWPARVVLPRIVARGARATVHGQGIGRHPPEVVYAMAFDDIDALATLLGDREYLFGEPSSVDASAYGLGRAVLAHPFDSPLRDRVAGHRNLVDYVDRITARWW